MKMITDYSKSVDTAAANNAKAPFHMVLVHDGDTALGEGRRIVERLLRRALAGLDVHRDELSFSEIAHPEIRTEAAELAAGCDLFIFATVNGANLPNEVVAWLHLWFQSRHAKEAALVCLVGSEDGAMLESPTHLYLQHLSDDHNLAFFSSAFVIAGQNLKSQCQQRNETPSMRHMTARSFPRPEGWGINE
jgi:hypothetical protein